METNVKRILTNNTINEIGSAIKDAPITDTKIVSNDMEVRNQSKEYKKLFRALNRMSPEFKNDMNYLASKDFDIKKLKKYDQLRGIYEDCKGNTDEYSALYCQLFEFLSSPKCTEMMRNVKESNGGSYGMESLIGATALGTMRAILHTFTPILKFVAVAVTICTVTLIVMGAMITVYTYKRYKVERERLDYDKSKDLKSFFEGEHKFLVNGLLKPIKPVVKWLNNLSQNSGRVFKSFKSNSDKIEKQSGEFVFTVMIVIVGIGIFVLFLRWAIGFAFKLRVAHIKEYEEADEIIRYRIEELEKEINDPRTPKAKREALVKIKTRLIKSVEKLEAKIEKLKPAEQRIYSEQIEDDIEDTKVIEAEADQNDDEPAVGGPAPVFL